MKLGSNIKKYRTEKGLTQEKFAYDLGVSAQAVSRWENNITYPDISMLPILADYFETSIDDLMGRVGECPLEERENFFKASRECSDSVEEQISMHREMLKKYPNDTYIQFSLSSLLYMLYKCNADLELEEEIKQLCSRIEQSHKPDMQCGARRIRALLCIQNKGFETAKKLINMLPSYLCGRELMIKKLIKAMNMEKIYSEILQKVSNHKERPLLIAIDGRCAAGKTTLAAWLKEKFDFHVNIIHMDHFFLQPYQRTKERLLEPGGNIDYERFLEEVMLPLTQGKSFSYQIYDCGKMELSSKIQVKPAMLTIVEGSYSCHPVLWDFYHLRIFLNVAPEEQLHRIYNRNGAKAVSDFQEKWIPLEEKYFTAYQIQKRCDYTT